MKRKYKFAPTKLGGIDEDGRAYIKTYSFADVEKGDYSNPTIYHAEDFKEGSFLNSLLWRKTILYIIRRDYKRMAYSMDKTKE